MDKHKKDELKIELGDNVGEATRVARAKAAHRQGGPRAGIRAYCGGNKWAIENARAVGNY